MVFDDNAPAAVPAPPDLSAPAAPLARDVLPPASVLSPAQEAFRRDLFATLQSAFEVSAASGAVRRYEATLRNIAPEVTVRSGAPVLLMSTEAQFFAFSGAVLM